MFVDEWLIEIQTNTTIVARGEEKRDLVLIPLLLFFPVSFAVEKDQL